MKIKKLMVAAITAAWCMVSWAAGLLSGINPEYTLAGGIAPATIDLSSVKAAGWTISVSGLPSGIQYNTKTCKLTGTATKEGTFNVTFKATKKGSPTETAGSTFISKFCFVYINVYGAATVTGNGYYPAGKKVTLKATAKKGYVFAGWMRKKHHNVFEDLTGGEVDFRSASYPYVMGTNNVELFAFFATPEEDQSTFYFNNSGTISTLTDGSFSGDGFDISGRISSRSLPVITMSGLPSGLKFDAKKFLITGKATKPGTYTVKVTAKNASVNPAIKKDLTIIVPNFKWDSSKTGITINDSYTLGAGLLPSVLENGAMLAQNGYKLAVSGLPPGIKFDAKTGKFSGVATKEGEFTVYFKATKSGAPTETATATFKSNFITLTINHDPTKLTVTGEGRYPAGKKVTLKATPKKGYVFAGWYDDGLNEMDGDADFRQASQTYVTRAYNAEFSADYASVEDDRNTFSNNAGDDVIGDIDGTVNYSLRYKIKSCSFPTVSLSGLPTGLKFDAKKLKITGKTTKPGTYTVKVSAKNASVTKAVVKEMTITVPNIQSGLYNGKLDYVMGTEKYAYTISQKLNATFVKIPEGAKISASGVPAGMKFDANTGKITGAPTKAGTYTVTLTTTTVDKEKKIDTVTFTVNPIASWGIGTFQGYTDADRMVTATVTANGAISGKITYPVNGKLKTVSFSAKNIDYGNTSDCMTRDSQIRWYIPNVKWHDGSKREIDIYLYPKSCNTGGAIFGRMDFGFVNYQYDPYDFDDYGYGWQNPWTVSPTPELVPKISGTFKVPKTEFKNGDAAELSISSKGVATVKYYKGAGKNVSWTVTGNMVAHSQIPTLSLWSYIVNVMSPDGGIYAFYILATSDDKGVLNAGSVYLHPEGMAPEMKDIE